MDFVSMIILYKYIVVFFQYLRLKTIQNVVKNIKWLVKFWKNNNSVLFMLNFTWINLSNH